MQEQDIFEGKHVQQESRTNDRQTNTSLQDGTECWKIWMPYKTYLNIHIILYTFFVHDSCPFTFYQCSSDIICLMTHNCINYQAYQPAVICIVFIFFFSHHLLYTNKLRMARFLFEKFSGFLCIYIKKIAF